MAYEWKTVEEVGWVAGVAGVVAVAGFLGGVNPTEVGDWRALGLLALGVGGRAALAGLRVGIPRVIASLSPTPPVTLTAEEIQQLVQAAVKEAMAGSVAQP